MSSDPLASHEPRKRVRCHEVETRVSRDSRCSVRVGVEWEGRVMRGSADGTNTPEGRMMAGARAALQAVLGVMDGGLRLQVRGTKLIRAFDSQVVVVALKGESPDRRYDLIGSTVAPTGDVVRGAALAVLDATNRVMEPVAEPHSIEPLRGPTQTP